VPDVHKAISTALQEHRGMDADKADEHIEALKESERYVLEVYVRGVGGGDVADDRSDRGCLSSACCRL